MRRDTFTVPEQSHVVFRFRADNPGVWILHCHVAWHLEGEFYISLVLYCVIYHGLTNTSIVAGMAASFLERPDDLKALVSEMDAETRTQSQNFCAKQSR